MEKLKLLMDMVTMLESREAQVLVEANVTLGVDKCTSVVGANSGACVDIGVGY